MLPYYASVLLLKERLLRAELHKMVGTGFSHPNNWSYSVSVADSEEREPETRSKKMRIC